MWTEKYKPKIEKDLVHEKEIDKIKSSISKNKNICMKCDYHFKMGCDEYLGVLLDEGSFEETDANIKSKDFLNFVGKERYNEKLYFDFGISTEDEGRYLNSGLSDYKNSFGSGSTVYDTYEVSL